MNIARSFVTLMESLSFGTFGTDIYIGSAPQDAPDPCWWVVSSGGSPQTKNSTPELQKSYLLNVFYRNTDAENVHETIQAFEVEMNKQTCRTLSGFDTIEVEAISFPTDQDLDNEDRTVGLTQVAIRTYYKE
jgi:hypothetical protein